MQSVWRDIAVFLDGSAAGARIGRVGAGLARRHSAHLVGIYGLAHPPQGTQPESYARGAGIAHVLERQHEADERKVVEAEREFAELAKAFGVRSEFRVMWRDREDDDAVLKGLHSDLIVAAKPGPPDLPRAWTAEHLLLASGAPVLMVDSAWNGETLGRKIMIAWNGSREVRRAVNDAMPLLRVADSVTALVILGAPASERIGDPPGADLINHLNRHDVMADLMVVEANGEKTSHCIDRMAETLGADLLVIGAYSRPRTAEVLFGGTTRTLLAQARLPLFLSR